MKNPVIAAKTGPKHINTIALDVKTSAVINWHPLGTPGPWTNDAAFCENDHPLRIAMPNVRTMPGATIAIAEHNWNDAGYSERRISWKEAETNARAIAEVPAMVAALRGAKQFIENGIEFGFIRMPDADTPDAAHDTLPTINAILSRIDGGAA